MRNVTLQAFHFPAPHFMANAPVIHARLSGPGAARVILGCTLC
jgi:hypothetical protein